MKTPKRVLGHPKTDKIPLGMLRCRCWGQGWSVCEGWTAGWTWGWTLGRDSRMDTGMGQQDGQQGGHGDGHWEGISGNPTPHPSRATIPWEKVPEQQHRLRPTARYFRAPVNGIKGKKRICAPRSPAHVQGQLGAQHAHGAAGALRGQLDTALLRHRGQPGHPRVPRPAPAGDL